MDKNSKTKNKSDVSNHSTVSSNSKSGLGCPKQAFGSKLDTNKDQLQSINIDDSETIQRVLREKTRYQIHALFMKNYQLQSRQKLTNLLQLLLPILLLSLCMFLREAIVSNSAVFANQDITLPIPFFYNMPLKPLSSFGQFFNVSDCQEWYQFSFNTSTATKEDMEYFGGNTGIPMHKPMSSGMLRKDNIQTIPCQQINKSVPFFEFEDQKNGSMNYHLKEKLTKLGDEQFELKQKYMNVPGLHKIPDGMIEIWKSNPKEFRYRLQINDYSYFQYHRNNGITKIGLVMPGAQQNMSESQGSEILEDTGNTSYVMRPTEGAVALMDRMNQAYIRSIFNDTFLLTGQQLMPFRPDVKDGADKVMNALGGVIYPLYLSLSLPVFLYTIVLEKEQRLIENMKINGLNMLNYWKVNYVFNFMMYLTVMTTYLSYGKFVSGLTFFTDTDIRVLILTNIGWGLCQISIAFTLAAFLNNSQTASMFGYIFSIILTLAAGTFVICGGVYDEVGELSYGYYPIPMFLYTRICFLIADACTWSQCISRWSEFPDELFRCIKYLYIDSLVYLILALYLNQVMPQKYGVPKHPLFFLEGFIKSYFPQYHSTIFADDSHLASYRDEQELQLEDQDARDERQFIYTLDRLDYADYPLIAKDVRKVYPALGKGKPKIANKNINLKINNGELFGLLGPNGAGKTTLISQLTGLYQPTSGNAWIGGFSIKTQLEIVQLQIGLCPQFDVLWNELTVQEHLEFYARIKGVNPSEVAAYVQKAMHEVQLTPERNFQVSELPLGMRRRLSIAISLVSSPKIIFLDEPTTGLDPDTRRQLWNILQDCKKDKNRAMILTTHSMEEADILCNRIAIVNDGVLRCIGSQNRLKLLYGGGLHLFINCHSQKSLILNFPGQCISEKDVNHTLSEFISNLLPNALKLRHFNGQFVYQVPLENFDANELFQKIELNKQRLKIVDWGISQCSLEDVFTRICELS